MNLAQLYCSQLLLSIVFVSDVSKKIYFGRHKRRCKSENYRAIKTIAKLGLFVLRKKIKKQNKIVPYRRPMCLLLAFFPTVKREKQETSAK